MDGRAALLPAPLPPSLTGTSVASRATQNQPVRANLPLSASPSFKQTSTM